MMNSKLIGFSLFFIAALSSEAQVTLYEAVEPHMGTLFQIKLYAADSQKATEAFRQAFSRIANLDQKLSDYKSDSELNLATRTSALKPTHVSDDLYEVLAAAMVMSEETGGAFDVTVGPLTKLWRQARKQGRVPDDAAIKQARNQCGYRKLHLDPTAHTIKVDSEDLEIDLGAIAKGYAADEALKVINNLGIRSALVAASGDLAFSDAPPGQKGWTIGIDGLERSLLLANAAVSTSGASEQNLQIDGKRYSHIIDPKTGLGLVNDITVTTVSRHGLRADPAATALSVLGAEKGLAFVENTSDLAAFIVETISGQVHSTESIRFRQYCQ